MSNQQKRQAKQSRKRQRQASGATGEPAQKKQKTQGQKRRQNKRRNQRNGRAMTKRGTLGGGTFQGDTTRLERSMVKLDDVIVRDEFIADLLGSNGVGNVVVTKYPFNPGQAALFPIGAAEAKNWTCWKCVKAEPYLLHEVSEFATDGSTGKMGLSFDYNAENPTPTTKQQLEDMHSASCMPCEDISLPLLTEHLNRADPKYVRIGAQPSGTDIRLYDGGNLYTWVSGQAGASKVAELRIRYHFEVYLPTLLNQAGGGGGGASTSTSWFQSTGGSEASGATTVAKNLLLATASSNGLAIVNTAGSFVPPAGNYIVSLEATTANSGGNETSTWTLDIQKNAVSVLTAPPTWKNVVNATTDLEMGTQALISCNGTDAITFPSTVSYPSGTQTIWGNVIFQSVV